MLPSLYHFTAQMKQRLMIFAWDTGVKSRYLIAFWLGLGENIITFIPHIYNKKSVIQNSSVQFSHSVVSDSLQPHESQHARPPCPSPTPGVHSNSCPSSQWCHPAISSSVIPFSSCPQSLPALGSFPMSQLFASGGQSSGVSASASVLPMNSQDWSPLGWTRWISLQSKGLSKVFSNTTVQKHQFQTRKVLIVEPNKILSYFFKWEICIWTFPSPVHACDPIDGSPPGSSVPGILQARMDALTRRMSRHC